MTYLKYVFLVILCTATIKSEFVFEGCPNLSTLREQQTFELGRYTGKWYEFGRANSIPFQRGDCDVAQYSPNLDGTVNVINSEIVEGKSIIANGKINTTSDPFRLQVAFSENFIGQFFKGDYQVLLTDYESFSIVYSCFNLFFARTQFYWILSRTPEMSQEKRTYILNYIKEKLNISEDKFRFTNQNKELCNGI